MKYNSLVLFALTLLSGSSALAAPISVECRVPLQITSNGNAAQGVTLIRARVLGAQIRIRATDMIEGQPPREWYAEAVLATQTRPNEAGFTYALFAGRTATGDNVIFSLPKAVIARSSFGQKFLGWFGFGSNPMLRTFCIAQ